MVHTEGMTDVGTGALTADEARSEALLTMARRETGQPGLALAEAEAWWSDQRDEMGLPSRWPSD
jgi:hypothetical protein